MIDISIIIVTYNSIGFIENCLESISKQAYKGFEIIVVDNDSQDKTIEFIKRKYPQIGLIENKQNKGFPFACNQGIKVAKGKYILTLNSDVILENDFLYRIKKAMDDAGLDVGMISPKLLWAKDKKIIDCTGIVLSWMRKFYGRGRGEVDEGQYACESEIFGPCAAAALYKREMLEDIKISGEYFDSDFFLLIEDFDLVWRAKNRGWKALYTPEAVCYHVRNISGMKNKYIQYLCFRNRYFLILKNESLIGFLRYFVVFFIYDLWRNSHMLIMNTRYFLKACYELIRISPKMLKRRYKYL